MNGTPREPAASPSSAGGATTSDRTRDALLIALTFAAGVVDAVSYLGLGHIFTANMTGNLVFLALAVGQGSLLTALYSVGALIGFSLGAIVAGQILVRPRPPDPWPRRVTLVLGGELACLTAFAALWAVLGGTMAGGAPIYVLVGLSSLGMGMQNAAARHLAVPGLTTTVVTTALTGFMVDLPALGISGTGQRRAVSAILALFLGAAVGAALVVYGRPYAPFVTVGAVATVVVVAFVVFDRRSGTPD
jgi:uncharacterized membrane protein YoaK (UPF0700 family)